MTQVMPRSMVCWFVLCAALCSVAQSSESVDSLKKTFTDNASIQMELALAQKKFSIMSRGLAETERCAARELLSASIGFREVTEQARMAAQIVSEMTSADDQSTARKYLGMAAHSVVAQGENDLQLVDELLKSITTPAAIVEVKIIRDEMMQLRAIWKPYASEKRK
jgi:hypothetical protein